MNLLAGKNKFVSVILLIAMYIVMSNGFSLVGWYMVTWLKYLFYVLSSIFILYAINNKVNSKNDVNRIILCYLILIPLCAIVCKQLMTDEPISEERATFKLVLSFLFYFYLANKNISEQTLINACVAIGFITLFIQIFQQNSNIILFGLSEEDAEIFKSKGTIYSRNNIFRFHIGTVNVALLLIFYYWEKILSKFRVVYFLFFSCFCVSMYLYVTRQYMVSTAVTITISLMIYFRNKMNMKLFIVIIIIVIAIFANFEMLFGELIDMTRNDTYSTDIRKEAFPFIFEQTYSDPIKLFLGHGHDANIFKWGENRSYWINDLGVLGEVYLYGIVWFFIYIYTLHTYLIKYRKVIPVYLQLFFICTFIHSAFVFTYRKPAEVFVWMIAIYIGNIYIRNFKTGNKNDKVFNNNTCL